MVDVIDNPDRPFVLDANVLIDYCHTDRAVLSLVSEHITKIILPSPVLDKVNELDVDEVSSLGLILTSPTEKQIDEALLMRGPLSFDDSICLVMSIDLEAICITNDKALRRECETKGVSVMWGLEPMLLLVQQGQLTEREAFAISASMQKTNSYITKQILQRFRRKLGL